MRFLLEEYQLQFDPCFYQLNNSLKGFINKFHNEVACIID